MHHKDIDRRSLELHRLIVRKMEKNPERGIRIALGNISRWQKIPDLPMNLHLKWKDILLHRKWPEIRKILLSSSDKSQQLRQATPFCGKLTESERMKVFRKYSNR